MGKHAVGWRGSVLESCEVTWEQPEATDAPSFVIHARANSRGRSGGEVNNINTFQPALPDAMCRCVC